MATKTKKLAPLDFTTSEYDISGPAGNVFAIMGEVQKLLGQFGRGHLVDQYVKEAKAGDYKNAILVSDRYVQFAWRFPDGDEWEQFEQQLLDAR